jgi:hypothetical protein
MLRASLAFAIGLATALAAGWGVFPRVLYRGQAQPLEFRHKTHAAKSGSAECTSCHVLREDGEFAGLPSTDTCAGCHAEPMGTTKAEAALVADYVKPRRETPWLVYARQPANVRFSHAIHIRRAGLECKQCHGAHGDSDEVALYRQDRISGYSRTLLTMSACESCHRDRHVEAGCLGCHE